MCPASLALGVLRRLIMMRTVSPKAPDTAGVPVLGGGCAPTDVTNFHACNAPVGKYKARSAQHRENTVLGRIAGSRVCNGSGSSIEPLKPLPSAANSGFISNAY